MAATAAKIKEGKNMKLIKVTYSFDGIPMHHYKGLSNEAKPTGLNTGSTVHEIDTGKTIEYEQTTDDWYEQPTGGGSGGDSTDFLTDSEIENVWGD